MYTIITSIIWISTSFAWRRWMFWRLPVRWPVRWLWQRSLTIISVTAARRTSSFRWVVWWFFLLLYLLFLLIWWYTRLISLTDRFVLHARSTRNVYTLFSNLCTKNFNAQNWAFAYQQWRQKKLRSNATTLIHIHVINSRMNADEQKNINGIASQSASATLGKMINSVRQTKGKF